MNKKEKYQNKQREILTIGQETNTQIDTMIFYKKELNYQLLMPNNL